MRRVELGTSGVALVCVCVFRFQTGFCDWCLPSVQSASVLRQHTRDGTVVDDHASPRCAGKLYAFWAHGGATSAFCWPAPQTVTVSRVCLASTLCDSSSTNLASLRVQSCPSLQSTKESHALEIGDYSVWGYLYSSAF